MKVLNIFSVMAFSSASMLFSTGVLANNVAGVYSFTVCGPAIQGVANLSMDGSVTVIDTNENVIDSPAIGIWEKDSGTIKGKATFYRGGSGATPGTAVVLNITDGVYKDNQITGTLNIGPVTCPDLLLTRYSF